MIRLFILLTIVSCLLVAQMFWPLKQVAIGKSAWQLVCKKERTNCHMASYIRNSDQKVFSALTLQNVRSKKGYEVTMGLIQLPLGLHIPTGVSIRIDDAHTFPAKLVDCQPKGCRAVFKTTPRILTALKEGGKAHIIIKDSKSHKLLSLNFSLIGFTQTWASLLNMGQQKTARF